MVLSTTLVIKNKAIEDFRAFLTKAKNQFLILQWLFQESTSQIALKKKIYLIQ